MDAMHRVDDGFRLIHQLVDALRCSIEHLGQLHRGVLRVMKDTLLQRIQFVCDCHPRVQNVF